MRPNTTLEIDITTLVHGGRGLGRHEGKAVFVPLTLPGDRVRCRIVKAKSRYAEAELLEVLTPSTNRRQPPCPYFGLCGGCQWQHLAYEQQTGWKQRIFADLMTRGGITTEDRLLPIVASPDEWLYRNRVQFKCHLSDHGVVIGFYRTGSHQIVDVEHCRLVVPPIQRALTLLRDKLPTAPHPEAIHQLDVACGDDDKVRVVLHARPVAVAALRSWLRDLAREFSFDACLQTGNKESLEIVSGDGYLTVHVDSPQLELCYGPGGFAQVNSSQNRNLVSTMLERLNLQGHERALDLFCGMGNFSLPLARRAAQVVGVEDYAPAIADALGNAERNNLANLDFFAEDAAGAMARAEVSGFDLVVLDPPRTGNYSVAKELLDIGPNRILYVSCDPATLVRDLNPLVNNGYEVASAQTFDLFPQTWHIESMTLLLRS